MARSKRSPRSRGGRGRRDDAPPPIATTQEMVALDFSEQERSVRGARGRTSGGGGGGSGIGLMIPLVVTLIAAVLLFGGGALIASAASKGGGDSADNAGIAAALVLSAPEPDWWRTDHGVGETLFDKFRKNYDEMMSAIQRDPDKSEVDQEVLKQDYQKALEYWGIQKGARDAQVDAKIVEANQKRLSRLLEPSGGRLIWAGVISASKTWLARTGPEPTLRYGQTINASGGITVTPVLVDNRYEGRLYIAPITDKFGQAGGEARVIVAGGSGGGIPPGALVALVVVGAIGVLAVGAVSFFLCMGASKGIRGVTAALEQVAGGDVDVRIPVRGGGEIAGLARAADRAVKMTRILHEQAAAPVQAAPAPDGEEVDTASLLPSEPPRIDGYEIEAVHKPCPRRANDFFDYIQVDATHWGVVIADMPHPGAKGAFIAATFRAPMRAYAPEEHSAAEVLGLVNRIMAGELKRGDHISAMYTILDTESGIVTVASAGHLPLIFWKLAKKGSALLNPEGIAIGLDKGPVFEKTVVDKRIKLEKGDRIVLHTDGPVAAKNMEGEEYGEQRFYYLVSREAPKNSAAFVNFVANEVDLFHEGAMQEDDITVLTVRKLA